MYAPSCNTPSTKTTKINQNSNSFRREVGTGGVAALMFMLVAGSVVALVLMSLVGGGDMVGRPPWTPEACLARLSECPTLAIVNIFPSHWQRSLKRWLAACR